MIVRISSAAQNAAANAIVDLLDGGSGAGTISFYTGPMPASTATAITSQTLLGTATFSDPAFGNATAGTVTAASITQDSAADATGTCAWLRLRDSNGNTVIDLDAGLPGSGAAAIMPVVALVAGLPIQVTSMSFTMPSGE